MEQNRAISQVMFHKRHRPEHLCGCGSLMLSGYGTGVDFSGTEREHRECNWSCVMRARFQLGGARVSAGHSSAVIGPPGITRDRIVVSGLPCSLRILQCQFPSQFNLRCRASDQNIKFAGFGSPAMILIVVIRKSSRVERHHHLFSLAGIEVHPGKSL
jgi:hypothetical protein